MGENPIVGLLLTFVVTIGIMVFLGNIIEVPLLVDVPMLPDIIISTLWLGGIMAIIGAMLGSWLLMAIGAGVIVHWYLASSIAWAINLISNILM